MAVSPIIIRRLRAQAALHGRKRRRRPPRWLFPMPAERKYVRQIRGYIDAIQQAYAAIVLPRLPALAAQAKAGQARPDASGARTDGWPEATAQLLHDFAIQAKRERASRRQGIRNMAAEISTWNKGQWRKVVTAALGVDLVQAEPWLQDNITAWTAENASLITTLEDSAISDVENWTMRGLRTGDRHEDIADKIQERFDVSASRAEFIARDQTAKLNADITQSRQTSLGVTGYFWRTAGDDRVRPSHAAHNGKRYDWDSPPADTGHPGEDYQCRCGSDPDFSGLLAGLDEIGEGG